MENISIAFRIAALALVFSNGQSEAAPSLQNLGTYLCGPAERCEALAVGPMPDKSVAVLVVSKGQGQESGSARLLICAAGNSICRKVSEWPTESPLRRSDVDMLSLPSGIEFLSKDSASKVNLRAVDGQGVVNEVALPFSLDAHLIASDGVRRMFIRSYAGAVGLVEGSPSSGLQVLKMLDGIDMESIVSTSRSGSEAVYARVLKDSTAAAPKAVVERISKAGVARCRYVIEGVPESLLTIGAADVMLYSNIGPKGDDIWSVGLAECASAVIASKAVPKGSAKIKSVAMACGRRCSVAVLTRSRFEVFGVPLRGGEPTFNRELEFSVLTADEVLGDW